MNEWALVRMRQIQVYQQSHHAAGHMTGLERCSALIPWLIQIKYLGNTDFLLALVFFKLWIIVTSIVVFNCKYLCSFTNDGCWFNWSGSCCFSFLAIIKNRVTSRVLTKWTSPLTRSSVMKTCLPHLGVTWIMVKFQDTVHMQESRFYLCCASMWLWSSPQMTCLIYRRWRRTRGPQGCTTLGQECCTRSSAAPPAPTGWPNWPTLPLVLRALYWKTSHIRGLISGYFFIHHVHHRMATVHKFK